MTRPGTPPDPAWRVPVTAIPPSQSHGFLFADLREYSRFVEKHGDHAAAELLTSYRALVRQAVAQHAGAEIRTEATASTSSSDPPAAPFAAAWRSSKLPSRPTRRP